MSDIAHLLDKLERLRQADHALSLFGARDHRYQLGPPVTESKLARFERLHRVMLPGGYRDFLLHAGDGGAGPYYGLYSLETALISAGEGFLAHPFPYQHWWNGIDPPDWWASPHAEDLDEHSAPRHADYDADRHVQGTLRLAHEGCGYYCLLVISGAERGHMWSDGRSGDGGVLPLPHHPGPHRAEGSSLIPIESPATRLTFFAWYEEWLDTSLRTIEISRAEPRA
jgi:hypothetical protein